ncbi:MAG: hypothetical protein EXS46_00435 [Candidatus Taylorbacteria bacterium]|nr:hypothetical protein [Candidatus Taylorbacteria bacterium]
MENYFDKLYLFGKRFPLRSFFLLSGFLFMILFSLFHLTTQPRLWLDEAKNIEIAQSFNTSGKFDMELSLGHFSEVPHLLQSTGYPVTIPLALTFRIFGFGLVQARLFMLAWMIVAMLVSFILLKKIIGFRSAVFSILLIVTFASFYDNGRPMMGEIPGFLFLVSGLYYWLCRQSPWIAGGFFSLAVVSKPSVYLLIIPTLFFVLIFRGQRIKNLMVFFASMLPAALGWIFLVMSQPFSKLAWFQIIDMYGNPYNAIPIMQNILNNIISIPRTLTIVYFGIFFILLLLVRIGFRKENYNLSLVYDFVLIYSLFAFLYYLRSPGWLRYTIVSELLILAILPNALEIILLYFSRKFKNARIFKGEIVWYASLVFLVVFQIFHLFNGAKIYFSDSDIMTAKYIEDKYFMETVGYVDALNLAIFKDRKLRFMTIEGSVVPILKSNNTFKNVSLYSLAVLPEVLVLKKDIVTSFADANVLNDNYKVDTVMNGYAIYVKSKIE